MAPNVEAESEDKKVRALTHTYPEHFEILTERNKVVCKLTRHELPLNASAIQTYINGKKFQYYLKKVKKPATVRKIDDKYAEFFRASKKFPTTRLYCTLTRKEINKQPHEIERYITGYKFLKTVAKHRERKEKGEPEPEPEEEEGDEEKGEAAGDGEEEDKVPSYALSSEGEEEVEEVDKAGDMDEEDIIEEDIIEEDIIEEDIIEEDIIEEDIIEEDVIEEDIDDGCEGETNSLKVESSVEVVAAGKSNESTAGPSSKGKKRKSKGKKNKGKSKKLKPAGL